MRRPNFALCLALFLVLCQPSMFAAKKIENWQTGKIAEPPQGSFQSLTTRGHIDYDPHVIAVQDGGTLYTARETHPWHGWCLFTIGDQIKYATAGENADKKREPHILYLTDATGTKCKFEIVSQQKH